MSVYLTFWEPVAKDRILWLRQWSGSFIRILGCSPHEVPRLLFESGNAEESEAICDLAMHLIGQRGEASRKLISDVWEYSQGSTPEGGA